MYQQPGPHSGPPPICFNCSKEGHFVVDCPEPRRTSIGGPPGASPPNLSNGNFPGNQAPQWSNGRNVGAPGAIVTQFPKPPPVVTRYAVPSQSPQYGNSPGSYGPSPTASPYQHLGSAPPGQPYPPPSQTSYPPQQYGASAPPYSQNPPPQSYSAPPPNSQYGQGYQASPQNPYPTPSGPQYDGASPQQYAPPATQYQSPASQYPPRNNSYTAPPPPQWNKTPSVSTSSPYGTPSQLQPNQQLRNSSIQREFSGTPSQQPPSQQTPQNENGHASDNYQHTPQTPTSGYNLNGPTQTSQSSPINESYFPPVETAKSATGSVPSSRASTPYGRYGSIASNPRKLKSPSLAAKSRSATPDVSVIEPISLAEEAALKEAAKEATKKDAEEGEYTEEDLLQEQFNWDYKKIFKVPEPTESVALSQPLSYTYNVTPVPLMDSRVTISVSRYARKDNLKEYLRPIRSQSQWDYLKEDPAFSDNKLEGSLVPLREVRSWMEKRHGIEEVVQVVQVPKEAVEEPREASRKRAWSDEQEDVDNQIQLEASIEQNEPSNKRQKNEQLVESDSMEVDASGTPAPGTPTIGRSGTPTFGVVDDDAWAPEPGEAASAPMDPTEALLASLGVSGAPKPVREQSLAEGEDQFGTPTFGSMPHSMSPQTHPSDNNTPHNNANPIMPPQGSQEAPQTNGYGNPQYNTPQQGSPPDGNSYGPPQSNVPYSNHGLSVYNNDIPPQPTSTPPYGPPQQYGAPYSNPPAPQRQSSFTNNQYGPPQGQYPPQSQYGPPQSQYPPQGQYGPPQPQYNDPTQGQWGPPQSQYNGPSQNQYGPPQYGPPQSQYNGPPQGQYGPPQGQYAGPPQGQYGPPQGQWGPPQGQYNNGYPSGPPNQGPGPQYGNSGYGPPQGQPQQTNGGYFNAPQQGNQQQFNNQGQGNQPPRQDSGYASARGSYSNGSGPNGFTNGGPPQQGQQQVNGSGHISKPRVDGGNDTPSPTELAERNKQNDLKVEIEEHKVPEPVESPLSPTSAEILGKLTQPSKPRKIIRVISGKNSNAARHADDSPTKKAKRPAPVVAEAYSRRW